NIKQKEEKRPVEQAGSRLHTVQSQSSELPIHLRGTNSPKRLFALQLSNYVPAPEILSKTHGKFVHSSSVNNRSLQYYTARIVRGEGCSVEVRLQKKKSRVLLHTAYEWRHWTISRYACPLHENAALAFCIFELVL
ncbi:hypothetical protein Tcan_01779, partial [Toxocara canis]